MDWYEIEVNGNRTVKFAQNNKTTLKRHEQTIGGIIKRRTWAWLAEDCTLRLVSLRNGQLLSTYNFQQFSNNGASIVCVAELVATRNAQNVLLAVCLDGNKEHDNSEISLKTSLIVIYSVAHGTVLSCMHVPFYVTCMQFLNSDQCHRSLLQNFDGCLAVGTQEGKVVLIDLYLNRLLELCDNQYTSHIGIQANPSTCHIVPYTLPLAGIHQNYQKCLRELSLQHITHFGLEMEVVDSSSAIESLLPINLITGLAVGLEDGRLVLYDLAELQIFYISSHDRQKQMPLVKMDFLEPPDDPRACFYVLALHDDGERLIGNLHAIMYEKRITDEAGASYFENFQCGLVKLQFPLEDSISRVISCQTIEKLPKSADDDATCLCAITWHSVLEERNKLIIFDLNQWYKEEMPSVIHPSHAISYLAGYILSGKQRGLDVYINPAAITCFNSIQRCEEHFYPNSLSFDCLLLIADGCCNYNWPGVQNRALNILRASTAALFLKPDQCFEQIRQACLLPQFSDITAHTILSKSAKYEVILSVALEHNCNGLLRDCVRLWADGSFMVNNNSCEDTSAELSLRTLTNWIWKRANDIKLRCNILCKHLLHLGGFPLDQRERKEFGFITRQLKDLAELLDEISQQYSKYNVPEKVLINMQSQHGSLHLAADYQELLLWLLNIGLLPEISHRLQDDNVATTSREASVLSSIYPYKQLRDFYIKKRVEFGKIDENCTSKKSGSCRLLFIDAFIEHECMRHASSGNFNTDGKGTLREFWLKNDGNGLYPPTTIESMLRIMLLPNVNYESKCAILLYFFMDFHAVLTESRHDGSICGNILEGLSKFPNVFKLPTSLVKNVQSFWHLDHGNFLAAVDEFLSPLNNSQNISQWLVELQVEALLLQNAAHLAIRILDAHPNLISPTLKLSILLGNNLIAEGFHFARSKDDEELMKRFFQSCLLMGKLGVIRDLALNEHEGQVVENLLRRNKLPGAENLHFVYLLQKSKYIEAVTYMDELSKEKSLCSTRSDAQAFDAPNLVISAFSTTMAPVTQNLTDVYFRIRNKIKQKETLNRSPVPLSCQLVKENANKLLGGVYHSSALSAHFATYYYDEELQQGGRNCYHQGQKSLISPLNAHNAPFLRKPQTETRNESVDHIDRQILSYPLEYKPREKRRLSDSQQGEGDLVSTNKFSPEKLQQKHQQQPSKRRRVQGEELLADLKSLKQKKVTLSDVGINLTDYNESSMAMPPVASSSSDDNQNSVDNISKSLFRPQKPLIRSTLHSILKPSTPEPIEPRKLRCTESPVVEEKTLRFVLPNSNTTRDSPRKSVLESFETPMKDTEEPEETSLEPEDSQESQSQSLENTEKTLYYSTVSSLQKTDLTTSLASSSVKDSGISLTAKSEKVKDSSSYSFYQSARGKSLSPSFGPKPRKPLSRMSAEPESIEKNTILFNDSKEVDAGNSGMSVEFKPRSETSHDRPLVEFKIASIATLTSEQFAPQICSSKVAETQSRFMTENIKFSERSTVVMNSELTCDLSPQQEEGSIVNEKSLASSNVCLEEDENNPKSKQPLLDTTLSMSSFEVTSPASKGTEITNVVKESNPKDKQEKSLEENLLDSMSSADDPDESDLLEHLYDDLSNGGGQEKNLETTTEMAEEVIELSSSSNESSGRSDGSDATEADEAEEENDIGDSETEIESEDDEEDIDESIEQISSSSDTNMEGLESNEAISLDTENEEHTTSSSSEIKENQRDDSNDNSNEPLNLLMDEEENSLDDKGENTLSQEFLNDKKRAEEEKEFVEELTSSQVNPEVFVMENLNLNPLPLDIAIVASTEVFPEIQEMQVPPAAPEELLVEIDPSNTSEQLPDNIDGSTILLEENKERILDGGEQPNKNNLIESFDDELPEQILESNKEEKVKMLDDELPEKQLDLNISKESEKVEISVSNKISIEDQEKPQSPKHENRSVEKSKSEYCMDSVKGDEEISKEGEESTTVENEEKNKLNDLDVSENFVTPNESLNLAEDTSEKNEIETEKIVEDPSSSLPTTEDTKKAPEIAEEQNNMSEVPSEQLSNEVNLQSTSIVEDPHSSAVVLTKKKKASLLLMEETKEENKVEAPKIPDEQSSNTEAQASQSNTEPNSDSKITSKDPISSERKQSTLRKDLKAQIDLNLSQTLNTPTRNTRGQSVPPQSLSSIEIDAVKDVQTPRRRSTRGISLPPQAIESVNVTPTLRRRRSSIRLNSVADEERSPQSPSSNRSAQDSQQIRKVQETSSNTPLDSPALRTRSRLRTISESSDVTTTSVNSPSTSLRRTRRTSISSTISEQQQPSQTPKRTRRNSTSGLSDTEGTPRQRRNLLKEVEEEAETESEVVASAESASDNNSQNVQALYSSARRLTRTQRALLEKAASQMSQTPAKVHNESNESRASISPQNSQTHSAPKRRSSQSASIKSHDDVEDDRLSVTSSVASETRRSSRRLRSQQQISPNTNLSAIPENDNEEEGGQPRQKRSRTTKK